MTTLPDLNPATAGHVAFYNLIEQGGLAKENLTYSDVTDNQNVTGYDTYDNGIILNYATPSGYESVTIRLKTDGWVVVTSGWDGSPSNSVCGADLVYDPEKYYFTTLTDNVLTRTMVDIMSELPDWGFVESNGFTKADIGLFEFVYNADAISHFAQEIVYGENATANSNLTRTISTSGSLKRHDASAILNGVGAGTNLNDQKYYVDGNKVIDIGDGSETAREDLYTGFQDDGEVEFTVSLGTNGGTVYGHGSISAVIYWSD